MQSFTLLSVNQTHLNTYKKLIQDVHTSRISEVWGREIFKNIFESDSSPIHPHAIPSLYGLYMYIHGVCVLTPHYYIIALYI